VECDVLRKSITVVIFSRFWSDRFREVYRLIAEL